MLILRGKESCLRRLCRLHIYQILNVSLPVVTATTVTTSTFTIPPRVPSRAAPPATAGTGPSCSRSSPVATARMLHQSAVPSAVWQRRTNKIIAAGITIIGLTMMLSLIPQCIYIGIVFVACALMWLGWMTMKEKKIEPPRPEGQHPASPVLFLVASHHLRQSSRGPTLADPEDKPPSYEQILKLDGLPPDYFSILSEKPPRYEDLSPTLGTWGACALPMELYTTELPRVHPSPHASTSVSSAMPLEATLHTDSTTPCLHELPASWSAQASLPPSYSATQSPSGYGSENSSFDTLGMESYSDKVGVTAAVSALTNNAFSGCEERLHTEMEEDHSKSFSDNNNK